MLYVEDRQGQLRSPVTEVAERFRQELASHIVLRSDITLKESLGQGQFGKIYRAVIQDNKVVAAKLLKGEDPKNIPNLIVDAKRTLYLVRIT